MREGVDIIMQATGARLSGMQGNDKPEYTYNNISQTVHGYKQNTCKITLLHTVYQNS